MPQASAASPQAFPTSRAQRSEAALRPSRAPLTGWVWIIALAQVAVLLATSSRYGYHRDEMYFVVAGGHPAFGYPGQAPIVPLLSAALHHLAPHSLTVLRLPSALAAAGTTMVAGLTAREVGGERR